MAVPYRSLGPNGVCMVQLAPSHTQVSLSRPTLPLMAPPNISTWPSPDAMAWRARAVGTVCGVFSVQAEPSHTQVSLRLSAVPGGSLAVPVPPNKTAWPWSESYAMAGPDRTGGLVSGDASVQFAEV